MKCIECYCEDNTITPLNGAKECLEHHVQYICGTCGRCICINAHPIRNSQRWNFPFQTLEIAMMYLRTADYTNKKSCGIYEIENKNGRKSYKIFVDDKDMFLYLKNNKDKRCNGNKAIFCMEEYQEFPNTTVRKLTAHEVVKYLKRRNS